ncbi:hypothetical protein BPAE_0111g00250 [Botrytis paeoniae]|uniref:Uncharacterized protein n=1 Tax=Botrytis paeoniae TaxID=278948 RepID=A0A4Z1FNP3_9HELO|nr:hypothetical protein BPAE_0111g00250 [Botrytis paeoniae]
MVRDESEDGEGHVDACVGRWLEPFMGSILKTMQVQDAFGKSSDVTMQCLKINGGANSRTLECMLQLPGGYVRVGEEDVVVNAPSIL